MMVGVYMYWCMWWCFYVTAGVSSYGGVLMYMFKFLLSRSLENHPKVGFPASEHTYPVYTDPVWLD